MSGEDTAYRFDTTYDDFMSQQTEPKPPGTALGRRLCRAVPVLIALFLGSAFVVCSGILIILPITVLSGLLLGVGVVHESRYEAPRPGESCFY